MKCVNVETREEKVFPTIAELRSFLELRSDSSIQKALHNQRSSNIIKGWEVSHAA